MFKRKQKVNEEEEEAGHWSHSSQEDVIEPLGEVEKTLEDDDDEESCKKSADGA